MGVPAFFRWLSKKYPSIVVHCDDGVKGQYHFDNLYLDMNGIIHPCSHPENKAAPETEEEMFLAIFDYVEDIMKIVKPKKLLYMAVDGVAPRAKMNQQRSRRFRAAQESYDKLIEIQKVKDDLKERGIEVKEKSKDAHFDSNVITPGTQFMINLSEALRTWIDKKLDADYHDKHDIWPKDLVIILSDASVPGEGEHKIMDYIRKQKSDDNYDPNLSHCLYGADADLIMLGLATHEPHFTILREEFKPNQPKPCDLCGQIGHELKDCTGVERPPEELPVPLDTEFIYIRLNVLREYLEKESQKCAVKLDFERFIDDYVFLCFFVGNDFLPHLPSLEIRENAIDRLILIYKHVMETVPDHNEMYLTKSGIVNKDRVQFIMEKLGEAEDEIFRQRQQSDLNFKERNKRRKLMRQNEELRWMNPQAIKRDSKPGAFNNIKDEASKVRANFHNSNDRLNSMLVDKDSPNAPNSNKRKLENDEDSEPEDNVQLYNDGYKERYYLQKFDCSSVTEIGKMVSEEYFKGLCWVLLYYYQGCPDWKWFFPYHYAPFASDFHNVAQIEVIFDSNAKPFRPLEQLMSVFPAASSKNLPLTWRNLMTNIKSPIIDFYPSTFRIDLNGKKAAWMGVALLPFIDEERLFKALDEVYGDLNQNEIDRNRLGSHLIFVSKNHNFLSPIAKDVIESNKIEEPIPLADNNVKLISGSLSMSTLYSSRYNNLYCCEYKDPQYDSGFIFPAVLLKNAKIPDPVLRPGQISQFENYNPIIGMNRRQNYAHLGAAGHRMVDRSVHRDRDGSYGRNNYQQGGNRYQNKRPYDNNQSYSGGGGGGGGRQGNYNDYGHNNRDSRHQYGQQQYGQQQQSNYSSSSYYQQSRNNYSNQSQQQQQQQQPSYSSNYQYQSNYNYQNRRDQQQQQQPPPQANPNIPSYYTPDYVANQPQQGDNRNQHYRQQQNYNRYRN